MESELERRILVSKTTGDFGSVWEQLVNTQFFVPVTRQDSGPQTKDFRFVVLGSPQDGKPAVPVAEDLQNLRIFNQGEAIRELGGKLLTMLNPEVGLLVIMSDGAFGVPKEIVQWLRSSVQLPPSASPT